MSSWPHKRQEILKRDYPKPTIHSNLKKKLSYIARIKDTTNFKIEDLQSEDLSRFVHEIIQTILSISLKKREIVQYIVEICHYFHTVYDEFKQQFIDALKNKIREISNDLDFMHVYLYYEIMRIGVSLFEIKSIAKMFEKMKRGHKYKLCLILSIIHNEENEETVNQSEYSEQDIKILYQTKNATLHFLKRLDDLSFERVFIVMKNLNEEKMFEKEYIEKNYIKVIEVIPSEFKFYEPCEVMEQSDTKLTNFLTHLLWFIKSPAKVDFIAKKQLNNYKKKNKDNDESIDTESNEFKKHNGNIIKQILKYIPNLDTQPVLARFVMWFQIKTLISFLEADSNESSFLFLCELSKLNAYSKYKILDFIEDIIRGKNIDFLILVFNSIGRFFLHRKETNFGMRKLFEKIKIIRNESSGTTRSKINDLVAQIMNKSQKNATLDDFFAFMISENRWKGSQLESILTNEHLYLLFLKPWIFDDLSLIYQISKERKIDKELSKILYESFLICILSGKMQQSISYITLFSYYDSDIRKITDKVLSLDIQGYEKAYLLMAYANKREDKYKIVDDIGILVEYSHNIGCRNQFMHFISKHNLRVDIMDLDKEIESLQII